MDILDKNSFFNLTVRDDWRIFVGRNSMFFYNSPKGLFEHDLYDYKIYDNNCCIGKCINNGKALDRYIDSEKKFKKRVVLLHGKVGSDFSYTYLFLKDRRKIVLKQIHHRNAYEKFMIQDGDCVVVETLIELKQNVSTRIVASNILLNTTKKLIVSYPTWHKLNK